MRANVEHNHVLHEHVVILSIETRPSRASRKRAHRRRQSRHADDGIVHVSARFGYMETAERPARPEDGRPAETEGRLDVDQASYFLSKIELRAGDQPTMAPWRKRLFIATSYITADAAGYFGLPRERTVIIGSRIEV